MNGFSEKVSGSALVAGGACLAVFWAIISQFPNFAGADVVLDPLQLTAQGFHLAASPLLALGLVPLASRRMRPGVLTVLGVVATMVGLLGLGADGWLRLYAGGGRRNCARVVCGAGRTVGGVWHLSSCCPHAG